LFLRKKQFSAMVWFGKVGKEDQEIITNPAFLMRFFETSPESQLNRDYAPRNLSFKNAVSNGKISIYCTARGSF